MIARARRSCRAGREREDEPSVTRPQSRTLAACAAQPCSVQPRSRARSPRRRAPRPASRPRRRCRRSSPHTARSRRRPRARLGSRLRPGPGLGLGLDRRGRLGCRAHTLRGAVPEESSGGWRVRQRQRGRVRMPTCVVRPVSSILLSIYIGQTWGGERERGGLAGARAGPGSTRPPSPSPFRVLLLSHVARGCQQTWPSLQSSASRSRTPSSRCAPPLPRPALTRWMLTHLPPPPPPPHPALASQMDGDEMTRIM